MASLAIVHDGAMLVMHYVRAQIVPVGIKAEFLRSRRHDPFFGYIGIDRLVMGHPFSTIVDILPVFRGVEINQPQFAGGRFCRQCLDGYGCLNRRT